MTQKTFAGIAGRASLLHDQPVRGSFVLGAPTTLIAFMTTLLNLIDIALEIYIWLLLAVALLFLLIKFKAVDANGRVVGPVYSTLDKITEPARRPIRRLLPDLGEVDVTPVILIVLIVFVRYLIALYVSPLVS